MPPCAPSLESSFELRDRSAVPELTLRAAPTGERPADPNSRDLCEGDRLIARLVDRGAAGLELDNAAGDPQAKIHPATDPGGDPTLELLDPGKTPGKPQGRYRLHTAGELLRILDPIGVPAAQISTHEGKTAVLDAAGVTLATSEIVDGKRVLRGRDGAVIHYVSGISDERAAAAFAVEPFPAGVRLLLARFLDRNVQK
jgi:hypothetical protein